MWVVNSMIIEFGELYTYMPGCIISLKAEFSMKVKEKLNLLFKNQSWNRTSKRTAIIEHKI